MKKYEFYMENPTDEVNRLNSKDPFVVLNVPKNASSDDIKKAYINLMKKHHPDKNAAGV